MGYDIETLQSLLSCGNLSSDTTGELSSMLKKEKERKVLQKHKYKISGPFHTSGNRMYYTTRAPWTASKKIGRYTYDDIIDALYDHYFADPIQEYTVQEVFEMMSKEYDENHILAHLTIVHYNADWDKYMVKKGCSWLNTPIKKVLPGQIYEHYRLLTVDGTMKRSTFTNVKSVVNAVFNYAIIHNVPCIKSSDIDTRRLNFAPAEDKWDGVYNLTDRKKILDYCKEIKKPTVYTKGIELMFCLDIRISELRALYKEDVDLEHKTVYIAHQMVDVKTDTVNRHSVRIEIMKGKKDAGKRIEPLSKRAVEVIEWLMEQYPTSDWLLPSMALKTPIRTHRFNDNLKRICEKVGVKYFSSHGIRFHNISAMYDAGINEKEIQRVSGHTNAKTTRHYNKPLDSGSEDDKIREVMG